MRRQNREGLLFLQTGSSADGLVLPSHMTSSKPDVDVLYILGSNNNVSLTQNGRLRFTRKDCPVGYGMVRQTGNGLNKNANNIRDLSRRFLNGTCRRGCEFRLKEYHGPAVLFEVPQESYDIDITHGLACDKSFPEMDDFKYRTRSQHWHSIIDLHSIVELPGILVPTGPSRTSSNTDHLFRMSFCQQELILISSTKEWMKRAALAFKYLMKSLKEPRDHQETSLDSYHCKTVFMWTLEEMEDSLWENESPIALLFRLFDTLSGFLGCSRMPNYWIPEQNLLGAWNKEEIREYIELVNGLKVQLLHFIKFQNTKSSRLVRDDSSHTLVKRFHNVIELLQIDITMVSMDISSTLQQKEQMPTGNVSGVRKILKYESLTSNLHQLTTTVHISQIGRLESDPGVRRIVRDVSSNYNLPRPTTPSQTTPICKDGSSEGIWYTTYIWHPLENILTSFQENIKPFAQLFTEWEHYLRDVETSLLRDSRSAWHLPCCDIIIFIWKSQCTGRNSNVCFVFVRPCIGIWYIMMVNDLKEWKQFRLDQNE